MGTGSSLVQGADSDDNLNDEIADELGVIKKIPVEYPQRKTFTTSLRSVGSFGKKKSSSSKGKIVTKTDSLRSALSFEFESDTEKLHVIRKEYEVFRVSKQSEIAELEVSKEKLQSENRRLRGESKVLQATCLKLRNEREMALVAEEQALQRAATFEKERDKVQRQFKIYREAKEREIQDLLQARRDLESKMQHLLRMHGYDDGQSGGEMVSLRNNMAADWWTSSLESEPSLDGLAQVSLLYGPDYSQALMERDGPFTNVSRDDWNAAVPSLLHLLFSSLQAPVQPPVLRVYISAPQSMMREVQILQQTYLSKLESLCEDHGRFIVLVHLEEDGESFTEEEFSEMLHVRQEQIKQSVVFLAFLGGKSNRFTYEEYHHGHLASPGRCCAVFCFKDPDKDSDPGVTDESIHLAEEMKMEIRKSSNLKLFDNYDTTEEGAQLAYVEVSRYLKKMLNSDCKSDGVSGQATDNQWCDTYESDAISEKEQVEALRTASSPSCEVGLSKYYSELNMHVSGVGHLPPLVVMGDQGTGKSLLLAKWICLQQGSMSGRLMLYHFVGPTSSSSASPVLMLKRLTTQLMRQVTMSQNLTCDPVHLEEEFPRWLEKVSSKLHGGITIVIDSADRLQGTASHMQWLLDPLPAGARVIMSVNTDTCPQAWRSWPCVKIEPLDEKERKDMLVSLCRTSLHDQISKEIFSCTSPVSFNPRFLCLLAVEINSFRSRDGKALSEHLAQCVIKEDNVELLCHILKQIQQRLDDSQNQYLKQVLLYITISRNGLTEPELLHLVPMGWSVWLRLYSVLEQKNIVTTRVGLIALVNSQVYDAVSSLYRLSEDSRSTRTVQQRIINFYETKMRNCCVTYRLVDELPWLLEETAQKESLKECLLDMNVFARFFERGRSCELVNYWKYIGVEQSSLSKRYLDVIRSMASDEEPSAVIANLYVAVGQFLKYLGLLSQAAPLLQKALEIRECVLDPDHPLVAQSIHHLAEIYAYWGNFGAAEAFYKQAIEILENALGPDHMALVKDLEGLAILYKKNEKYNLAEPYHKRAITIRQKSGSAIGNLTLKRKMLQVEELAVGPGSHEVAKSLNELGVLYYLQNNHEASKSFFQRSLTMREEVLGQEHPEVAQSLHNLAALYNDQKMYDKAEPLYERALEIRLKVFPLHHACVASTVTHLAVLCKKQGKYAKAEPLYRQALEAREKVLGENHPSVGTALNNLAVVLCLQNKQAEALPLYERALRIYEESLGSNHPRVAEALVNLAKVYYDQGSLETAVRLYKQASDIQNGEQAQQQARQRAMARSQSVGMLSNNSVRDSRPFPR